MGLIENDGGGEGTLGIQAGAPLLPLPANREVPGVTRNPDLIKEGGPDHIME